MARPRKKPMLRLNLGSGPRELDGFENLNPPGWRFEDGLPYGDGTVEAITISHSLMYVAADDLPGVMFDLARTLVIGGVIRVTEDDTEHPDSVRAGGWHDAATLTGPAMMRALLEAAGLEVSEHTAGTTGFRDRSLLQAWHGAPPKVFFLEGRKL